MLFGQRRALGSPWPELHVADCSTAGLEAGGLVLEGEGQPAHLTFEQESVGRYSISELTGTTSGPQDSKCDMQMQSRGSQIPQWAWQVIAPGLQAGVWQQVSVSL